MMSPSEREERRTLPPTLTEIAPARPVCLLLPAPFAFSWRFGYTD